MENKNEKISLKVLDMTCGACEQRIENGLLKLRGIKSVNASYTKNSVDIEFNKGIINIADIKEELSKLHYPVAVSADTEPGDNGFVSSDPKSKRMQWLWFAVILAAAIGLYYLLLQSEVFYDFPTAEKGMSLPVLFILGLTTSVHCIAMCGGINISQCANVEKIGSWKGRIVPSLLYNGGRIVSYTVIGGIFGAIGSAITPPGIFRGIVLIVAGVFMVIMGLNMLGLFPALRKIIPRLPKFLTRKVNSKKAGKGPFIVGLLNGFMPCGPLQAMQFYALSTASFLAGALSMMFFSAGTVPLMFGLGALSSFLSNRFTSIMMRVSAVLVILLGFIMLNNGLNLSGVSLFS